MGMFGSDYPPGCHSVPGDYDQGCPVCWGFDIDPKKARDGKRACICPECPECGEQGNPDCYKSKEEGGHGLVLNDAQKAQKTAEEAFYEKQCATEAEWAEYERRLDEEYQRALAVMTAMERREEEGGNE